jgi:voltage-gated potassium channel
MAGNDRIQQTLRRSIPRIALANAARPGGRLIRSFITLTVVLVLSTVGYRLAGWTWFDSGYMVVITIFSVGYEEVRPVLTPQLRLFTILVIVMGYASVIYVIGGFAQMLVDGDIRHLLRIRKMALKINQLENHIIVCGYGRMGRMLSEQLASRNRQLIVIERDDDAVASAIDAGHLVLQGNAIDEDMLAAAGVRRAATLATVLSDDAANVFITITARDMNENVQILARGEQPSVVHKLRRVGADHVLLTASIGADRLAKLILRPTTEALLRCSELPEGLVDELESIGLELDELTILSGSPLCGKKISDMRFDDQTGFLIVALRAESGDVLVHPPNDTHLSEGDSVIVLGHRTEIPRLCDSFQLRRDEVREVAK